MSAIVCLICEGFPIFLWDFHWAHSCAFYLSPVVSRGVVSVPERTAWRRYVAIACASQWQSSASSSWSHGPELALAQDGRTAGASSFRQPPCSKLLLAVTGLDTDRIEGQSLNHLYGAPARMKADHCSKCSSPAVTTLSWRMLSTFSLDC